MKTDPRQSVSPGTIGTHSPSDLQISSARQTVIRALAKQAVREHWQAMPNVSERNFSGRALR